MEQKYTDIFSEAAGALESEYAKQLLLHIEARGENDNDLLQFFTETSFLSEFALPQWALEAAVFLSLLFFLGIFEGVLKGKGVFNALQYVLQVMLAVTVTVSVNELLQVAAAYMRDFSAFFGILVPTFGVLTASGGNVATAASSGIALSAFLSVVQLLLQTAVPFVCALFCELAVLDAFSGNSKLLSLSAAIRNFLFGAFSLLTAIFVIAISYRNITAVNMDTVSAKTLRVLVSNAIPIVGGTIGDALRMVGGSLINVKNAIGIAAAMFLVGMYLPVFAILFGNGALLTLFHFLCDYFSFANAKSLFVHLKYVLEFVLAAYTFIFVIAILNIGIFLQTTPAMLT